MARQGKARVIKKLMATTVIHALSIDSKLLYERLRAVAVGDVILYAELTGILSLDVQGKARGALHTARRMARDKDCCVFSVIRGVGLKRLSDSETVQSGDRFVRTIGRTASRGMKQIQAMKEGGYEALPNQDKIKFNLYASALGAIGAAVRPQRMRRLETRVAESNAQLAMAKTLEAFKD